MQPLSPSALLDVWEQGMAQSVVQKALLLLSLAFPTEAPAALAQRSIGQRNALLLTLREQLFGSQFVSVATCPECGERVEFNFETTNIRVDTPVRSTELLTVDMAGYTVQFRLPSSEDLTAVLGAEDPAAVEQMLFTRCLLSVQSAGAEVSVATLPDAVIEAIVQTMDEVDPQANVVLTLTCPTCTHQWQAILDILGYLWSELDAWARRILREVHCLAFAYGWRECEILEMSPWRRQIYLEMIGS